jgi:hypothetical protein
MANDNIDGIEPITVTIQEAQRITGESRAQVYNHIGRGDYQAVKDGRKTLIIYASVKQHLTRLPPARIKPPKPPKPHPAREARRGPKPAAITNNTTE